MEVALCVRVLQAESERRARDIQRSIAAERQREREEAAEWEAQVGGCLSPSLSLSLSLTRTRLFTDPVCLSLRSHTLCSPACPGRCARRPPELVVAGSSPKAKGVALNEVITLRSAVHRSSPSVANLDVGRVHDGVVLAVIAALLHANRLAREALAIANGEHDEPSSEMIRAWGHAQTVRRWMDRRVAELVETQGENRDVASSSDKRSTNEAILYSRIGRTVIDRARFLVQSTQPASVSVLADDGARAWPAAHQ